MFEGVHIGLTKKAEPQPTRDVNRDSGTDSANGGWLRRLVRPRRHILVLTFHDKNITAANTKMTDKTSNGLVNSNVNSGLSGLIGPGTSTR